MWFPHEDGVIVKILIHNMKHILVLIITVLSFHIGKAQDLKAYQIYNEKGKQVDFTQMTKQLADYDVVLFGEYHNSSINHWLELKLAESLYDLKGNQLILGAEMLERDNQQVIDEYLQGAIDAKGLEKEARLWKNFKTDYKPLVDFAKEKGLRFVATNIPRRYAKMVAKSGMDTLDSLPKADLAWVAKLPIKVDLDTPGYREMKDIMAKHATEDKLMNFIAAQAVKDATMAESILKNRKRGQLFLHFNGNYHSKEHGGIYWYLKKRKAWLSGLKVAVISIAQTKEADLALPKDFVVTEFNLVLPEDMTKTY